VILVLDFAAANSKVAVEQIAEQPKGGIITPGNGPWYLSSENRVHLEGAAAAADDFHVSFEPEVDMPAVALAAGLDAGGPCPIRTNFRECKGSARGGA